MTAIETYRMQQRRIKLARTPCRHYNQGFCEDGGDYILNDNSCNDWELIVFFPRGLSKASRPYREEDNGTSAAFWTRSALPTRL